MKEFNYNNRNEFYKQAELFPPVDVIESDEDEMDRWIKEHRIKITIGDCMLDLGWNAEIVDTIKSALEKIKGYYDGN